MLGDFTSCYTHSSIHGYNEIGRKYSSQYEPRPKAPFFLAVLGAFIIVEKCYNIAMIFIIVYCAGLLALLAWAIFGLTWYEKKHKIPEIVKNIIGFLLFALLFFGGFVILNSEKNKIIEDYKNTQATFCRNSTRKDGEEITEAQCEYFEDVLNGKYSDLEGDYSDNYSY